MQGWKVYQHPAFSPHFSTSPRISLSLAAQDEDVSRKKINFFFSCPPKQSLTLSQEWEVELQQLRRSWWSSGRHWEILWDPPAGGSGWCDHPAQTPWTWEAPSWWERKTEQGFKHSNSCRFNPLAQPIFGIKKKKKPGAAPSDPFQVQVNLLPQETNLPCVVLKLILGSTQNLNFGA